MPTGMLRAVPGWGRRAEPSAPARDSKAGLVRRRSSARQQQAIAMAQPGIARTATQFRQIIRPQDPQREARSTVRSAGRV